MRIRDSLGGGRRSVATLALLVVAGAGVGLARVVHRLQVDGHSMEPALLPGDRLVAVRGLPIRPGDVVAVRDPRQPERVMVKRAAARTAGGWTVEGDNREASTDSRHFGAVPPGLVIGRVIYRYGPEPRAGRLPDRMRRPASTDGVPSASPWRSPTSTNS